MPDDIIKKENKREKINNIFENNTDIESESVLDNENEKKNDEAELNDIKNELDVKRKNNLSADTLEKEQVVIPITKQIENILQKGNEELYLKMSVSRREKFKNVGEMISVKISDLLSKDKKFSILSRATSSNSKVVKIANMIRNWLLISPDINKNYAEQEAKLLTDEIVKLNKE